MSIGIRIGIIVRESKEEAWKLAYERFPQTRGGRVKTLYKTRSENTWSSKIAQISIREEIYDEVYWTGSFISGKSSFPLLVGDYKAVSNYLNEYIDLGVQKIILGEFIQKMTINI